MDDTARTQLLQQEFRANITELAPYDGDFAVAEDVRAFRRSSPTPLHHGESTVSYCAIAQGAKQIEFGEHSYVYGPEHILITSIELPMVSRVVEASEEQPYLSLTLDLNPGLVRSVLMEAASNDRHGDSDLCAHRVKPMETGLLDATVRLTNSIITPGESDYLMPMIKREIIFRLLMTEHAGRLRQVAGMNPVSNQIKVAIEHIRRDFNEPLRVVDIASGVGMSVSSFHEHFKHVTGLTPLQYQKHLRLREARHLLMTEPLDAAEAGFRVGYNDASHFSRDYKKHFGQSPIRDVELLRSASQVVATSD